jgi:hypothetical protein
MKLAPTWKILASFAAASVFCATSAFAAHHATDENTAEAMDATTEAMEATVEKMATAETAVEKTTTPTSTSPSKYSCSLQGLVRRVEIIYSTDTSVPCDVTYYKDNEAPDEVNTLWSAQNLEGYCEQKAAEFVEKLQSWGWACKGE